MEVIHLMGAKSDWLHEWPNEVTLNQVNIGKPLELDGIPLEMMHGGQETITLAIFEYISNN